MKIQHMLFLENYIKFNQVLSFFIYTYFISLINPPISVPPYGFLSLSTSINIPLLVSQLHTSSSVLYLASPISYFLSSLLHPYSFTVHTIFLLSKFSTSLGNKNIVRFHLNSASHSFLHIFNYNFPYTNHTESKHGGGFSTPY